MKPLRAKSGLFRGKIFGMRKTYAYAGLSCLAIFAAVILFLTNTVRVTSLAVLPVQNLSGDPSQEFFAEGMTDALISDLAQIKAFNKVISRTSVMQYKDTKKSLPQIARELGVDLIVEASVTCSMNRVRIRARLMEANQERQLWARTYEREMTEVLVLQSELVRAITGEIRVQVTPQEREHLSKARLVNPEAYEAFLMGRLFLNKATAPAVEKSIEQFRKAIEKDPKNAAAYVGLGDAYGLLGQMASLPSAEVASQQREAAQKALEIDETLAEGHIALGNVKRGIDWDWEGAEREYKRAIELNPNSADARLWYSQLLGLIGRNEEALAQIMRARELDPLNPFIAANVLWRLYYLGRYDEAIADSQKLLEVYPDYWLNHWARGYLFSAKGMYEEAIVEHQNAVTLSEGSLECLPDLGYAYAKAGKKEEALNVLDKLREESKRRYIPAGLFAPVYLGFGEKDKVFEYLERAYQEHDEHTAWLLIDPLFEPLRPDPRFQDLRRRMKLPG
jgi:TolB-like protein/Flp pilus assembly protein TadD